MMPEDVSKGRVHGRRRPDPKSVELIRRVVPERGFVFLFLGQVCLKGEAGSMQICRA